MHTSTMRIARATFSALLGAIVTLGLYLGWFFKVTHQDAPWNGASTAFIVATSVVGILCGGIGGYLGATLAPETPRGTADGIAGLIAAAAAFAETHTPGQHHYAQAIALMLAAPAAYVAGRFRKATLS